MVNNRFRILLVALFVSTSLAIPMPDSSAASSNITNLEPNINALVDAEIQFIEDATQDIGSIFKRSPDSSAASSNISNLETDITNVIDAEVQIFEELDQDLTSARKRSAEPSTGTSAQDIGKAFAAVLQDRSPAPEEQAANTFNTTVIEEAFDDAIQGALEAIEGLFSKMRRRSVDSFISARTLPNITDIERGLTELFQGIAQSVEAFFGSAFGGASVPNIPGFPIPTSFPTSLPSISIPSLSIPSASLPTFSLPSISIPSVPSASVTASSLPFPSIALPSLRV